MTTKNYKNDHNWRLATMSPSKAGRRRAIITPYKSAYKSSLVSLHPRPNPGSEVGVAGGETIDGDCEGDKWNKT